MVHRAQCGPLYCLSGVSIAIGNYRTLIAQFCLRLAVRFFYNAFLSPLSKFPGPKLAAATKGYLHYYTFIGQKHTIVERLHDKYGEIVRISPDELSFITETAWKDIYQYRGKVCRSSGLLDK